MSASARSTFQSRVLPALIVFAIVPVLALLLAVQLVASTPMSWEHAFGMAGETWFRPTQFVLAAIVLSLIAPLERGTLRWSIALHLVVLSGLAYFHATTDRPQPPPGVPVRERREGPPPEFFGGPGETPGREAPLRDGPPPDLRRGLRGERRMGAVFFTSQLQFNLAAYVGAVGLFHALALYRTIAERDRRAREMAASLTRARLSALQLQLQPHFLFNSLNAISTLVHKDAHAADEMITNLSELLRLSLATKAPVVALGQELALLDRYVAIEQVRFGARLKFESVIEPAALNAFVPTLVLQPIVENAVRHGLEPKPGPGNIRVSARVLSARLVVTVEDDGVGLSDAKRRSASGGGIGLENTETRLRELYGADAAILIGPREGGGVCVTLDLPSAPPLDAFAAPVFSPEPSA